MQLSKNFWLAEFTQSQVATRLGISNNPNPHEIAALRQLAENVLQPIRDHFGKPVVINSGFRSPQVNHRIGGAASSQHTRGEAADIEIPGVSNLELAKWIRDNLEVDQLILEGYNPLVGPSSGWVHVSWRANPRQSVLTATFTNGRAHYSRGINA